MRLYVYQETRTRKHLSCSGKQPSSSPNTKWLKLTGICKDPQETKIQWRDRKLCWSRLSCTSSSHAADVVCVIFGVLIFNLSLSPSNPPLLFCSNPPCFSRKPLVFLSSRLAGWSVKGEVFGCQRSPAKNFFSKSLSFSGHRPTIVSKFSILPLS